jgi:hypothetical protein
MVSACTSGTPAASKTSAGAVAEKSVPACAAKAGFADHVGLAAGAVRSYVWKPFSDGAFKDGAKDRAKAMATAAQATKLAAAEMTAAAPLVADCATGKRLVNALGTGGSLSAAASKQLAAAKINTETLAGANSIVTTVLDEAKALGIAVTPIDPSADQLKTGAAG